jgi:hypothetical protein
VGLDEINMSQSIKVHTNGTRTNGTVGTTVTAQGQATIDLAGLGASNTLRAGDVFNVAGVFAVNPQTRETTGQLQDFVVLLDQTATGGGAASGVSISPPMFTAEQALATVTAFPQSGAVVTFRGTAGQQSPQNLVYHKDAITMATADLLLPQGVDMASRQVHNGISMRIVRQYDINNDRMPCRVDVLYGYSLLRGPMATRLWG